MAGDTPRRLTLIPQYTRVRHGLTSRCFTDDEGEVT